MEGACAFDPLSCSFSCVRVNMLVNVSASACACMNVYVLVSIHMHIRACLCSFLRLHVLSCFCVCHFPMGLRGLCSYASSTSYLQK